MTDSSQVAVTGQGLKMGALSQKAEFHIDPRGTEVGVCNIQVTSPSGGRVPVTIDGELPQKIAASFQPFEVGPHTINVFLDGEIVSGSPFTCNVYDVTRVIITGLEGTKVFT